MGNAFLGQGDLYIDRLTDAGVQTGLFQIGNAASFSIQPDSETKELTGKGRDNYGQVIASAVVPKPSKVSISLNEIDKTSLAIAFQGEVAEINEAAGSVSGEDVVLLSTEKYVDLAHRNISETPAVTVSRKYGASGLSWAAGTSYSVDDVVIPTTANGHFYKCTQAGTSDSTEPSSWPEDGNTVMDNTVTWLDMGLIALTSDDYEIHYHLGMIKPLKGGNLQTGETITVAYSYNAISGNQITGATQPVIKCRCVLDGKNYNDGKNCLVEVYEATLRPTKAIDFLSDDYETVDLEGTMVTPSGKSSPFIVAMDD